MEIYDQVESAIQSLHEIISFVHGVEPREYAIQGQREGNDWIIWLEYAPGKQVDFYASYILRLKKRVINRISLLEFEPVWRETETGQERIYA